MHAVDQRFPRGAAIDSQLVQHSLRKQPRDPRRKQAEIDAAHHTWHFESSTKASSFSIQWNKELSASYFYYAAPNSNYLAQTNATILIKHYDVLLSSFKVSPKFNLNWILLLITFSELFSDSACFVLTVISAGPNTWIAWKLVLTILKVLRNNDIEVF